MEKQYLFTIEEFNQLKSTSLLKCQCLICNNIFLKEKKYIQQGFNGKKSIVKYCSINCRFLSQNRKQKVNCKHCNKEFEKLPNQIKKTKNNFCSSSCAATYNVIHRKKGHRRSKIEIWIEEQLILLYPNLNMIFNGKETINSELDIYIPSLNLAIELNGIFHYEPIYGPDKLFQIQNNDSRKIQACIERGIEFAIIDISALSYFKSEKTKRYLDIITDLINIKLNY